MKENFELLESRVLDSLSNTDINDELSNIKGNTIVTGVGGSSVVSNFVSKVLSKKNRIISISMEPRDVIYSNLDGFDNILCCSYSGNNYGVDMSFNNDLNHYLLSKNKSNRDNVCSLVYNSSFKDEKSFISLSSTLIPISILLNYYEPNVDVKPLFEEEAYYKCTTDTYEIFSGFDTSSASTYLESTMAESGIGIPIVHDKYAYCHGRSTLSTLYASTVIYLNRNTEFDKLMMSELPKYYSNIIVLSSDQKDDILCDYELLIKSMYLSKQIAIKKGMDLSKVKYSSLVKKLYKYSSNI